MTLVPEPWAGQLSEPWKAARRLSVSVYECMDSLIQHLGTMGDLGQELNTALSCPQGSSLVPVAAPTPTVLLFSVWSTEARKGKAQALGGWQALKGQAVTVFPSPLPLPHPELGTWPMQESRYQWITLVQDNERKKQVLKGKNFPSETQMELGMEVHTVILAPQEAKAGGL